MRKRGRFSSLLGATIAVMMAALIGAAGFDSAALAQIAGTAGPVSLGDLFTTGVDLKPDAEQKLTEAAAKTMNARGCPLQGKFKVIVEPGDDLFQTALAQARRDKIRALLLAASGNLSFSGEIGSKNDVQVDYDRMPDREKPKLHSSSVAPKGTKVKAGDQIKVTMVARDDATRVETGIQLIQLIAQNPGGDALVGAQNYPPVIRANCEGRPEPRTLVLTYTVPRNPPPIVRLRAIAEDFANHHATDIAEFPTGDWYGTFGWRHVCTGGGNRDETRGIGDLTLDYDGRGNLTGTLAGSFPERKQTIPPCSFTYVRPGTFSAKLVGSYTPGQDTFSAQAVEVRTTPGRGSFDCGGGSSVSDVTFYNVYESQIFRDAFRDLRRQPDGSRKLIPDGKRTVPAGGGSCTTTYSLTLQQARD